MNTQQVRMIYQITEPRTGFRMALPWRGDLVKKGFEDYITNIPSSLGVDAVAVIGFDWEVDDGDGVDVHYTCDRCQYETCHRGPGGHSLTLYPVMLKALERDLLYSN